MGTYSRTSLVDNQTTVVCIQGYEDRRTQIPIYASTSHAAYPVIPVYDNRNLAVELACIVTGKIGAVIRGHRNSSQVQYSEIELHYKGNQTMPDTGSMHKFATGPHFEQHKIIAYGLNFDEIQTLVALSVIYVDCVTVYKVDKTDHKLKRVTTAA